MEKDELTALGAKLKEVALLAGTENFISREGIYSSITITTNSNQLSTISSNTNNTARI
jgi:hypothetical protein